MAHVICKAVLEPSVRKTHLWWCNLWPMILSQNCSQAHPVMIFYTYTLCIVFPSPEWHFSSIWNPPELHFYLAFPLQLDTLYHLFSISLKNYFLINQHICLTVIFLFTSPTRQIIINYSFNFQVAYLQYLMSNLQKVDIIIYPPKDQT